MKPYLVVAALLALVAVPALADNGQIMRDPQANYRSDYRVAQRMSAQCFHGKTVVGANRAGETVLLIQTSTGAIYELAVPRGCPALDSARKVTVRADGGNVVCAGRDAEMFARTAAGTKRCYVSAVRQMPSAEISALAQTPAR
jgi:transposase